MQVLAGSGGELDGELARRWEERQAGVRLLQTVCKLLAGVLLRLLFSRRDRSGKAIFLQELVLCETPTLPLLRDASP